jgi:hypothetical protein
LNKSNKVYTLVYIVHKANYSYSLYTMTSSIYFTSTRNVRENDIINAFEKKLQIGKIYDGNVNIIPVSNKNYNHVFFNITWNETLEAATFVSELISKSSVKVYHNHGYWLCRMNRNPLKLRNKSVACIKFSSLRNPVPVPVPVPVSADIFKFNEEDDFYVIN